MEIIIKDKKELSIAIINILCIIIVASIACYNGYRLNSYENYYNKTEILLDSISNQYEDFLDTTAEQDVYVEYLEARNKIDNK